MRKNHAIVYWLIPARAERELFREIIRILADQFDGPRFEPHLTLMAKRQDQQPRNNRGSRNLSESPKEVLKRIKASPIRLRARGIGCSSKFTKTLFVRFAQSKSLDNLVVDLAGKKRPVRDPHVSLLYKKMSILTKKELASTIKLPFLEVVFDSIKAVRCVLPVKTRADVEAWRNIATKKLGR